jgi:hypothetical protein
MPEQRQKNADENEEISRVMGVPGKPDGMAGSREIAEYCESDVVNT